MTRGGRRPGAGRPPVADSPQTERINLPLTEAERGEIEAAVPDDHPVGRWIVEAALMRARRATEWAGSVAESADAP